MTPSRLAALAGLTKAVGEAVVQGDLDRALGLLEQRRRALERIDWSLEPVGEVESGLLSLWKVNQEILDFCLSWREALQKRLEALSACQLLRRRYSREILEAKFVDLRK
ncbi:MAG: hypothetical protein QME75_06305 [Deltaproteobacteria bacterium]|nr:hypothetical protein [Deltaproteobacteria bacterium]